MKNYLRALSFLTIIPLPFVCFDPEGRQLSASAATFPAVGATIGLMLAGVSWITLRVFPPALAAIIALTFSFFITRGLHLDGLADTADGLIGTFSREKAIKAMKDSAIGVMGAATLIFVLLAKISVLAELGPEHMCAALIFMPLVGRWAIVYGGAWFSPAAEKGMGELFLRHLRPLDLLKASLCPAFLFVIAFWLYRPIFLPAVLGSLAALCVAHLLALYSSHRLGGLTGDVLGALSELGELVFLLAFFIALR